VLGNQSGKLPLATQGWGFFYYIMTKELPFEYYLHDRIEILEDFDNKKYASLHKIKFYPSVKYVIMTSDDSEDLNEDDFTVQVILIVFYFSLTD